MAHAKIKASKRLLSWLASLWLEMSVRYEVRLTEIFFQSKTTQITRSQPAVVITGSPHRAGKSRHGSDGRSPRATQGVREERTPMSTQPGPATPALTTHFEPYVSVEKAAEYLDIAPKTLMEKARKGEVPAYPWGNGMRKIWRFKISQLDEWMKRKLHSDRRPPLSERKGFQ